MDPLLVVHQLDTLIFQRANKIIIAYSKPN